MTDDAAGAGEPVTDEDLEEMSLADPIDAGGAAPTDTIAPEYERSDVAQRLTALAGKRYVTLSGATATITPAGRGFYDTPSTLHVSLPGSKPASQ